MFAGAPSSAGFFNRSIASRQAPDTRDGAMAALRMANDENQMFMGSEVATAMVAAALAYFEQEARS